jgi:hypothetical protein
MMKDLTVEHNDIIQPKDNEVIELEEYDKEKQNNVKDKSKQKAQV